MHRPCVSCCSFVFMYMLWPIGLIKIVCLQQEKWISGGKTFDMLCLFCQSYELICAWKGWLYVSLWKQRRRISRLVIMYKIQHQLVDIDRDLYLRPGDSRTRGQHRFFQERSNYDTLRNSFQRSGQLFFVHFLMSVSGFRLWDHKPLLRIPGMVGGS
jgi:hypothetical protein